MTGSRGQGKRPPSAGKQKHKPGRKMTPALLHSLNHPIRRQILRLLGERSTERSPADMARLVAGGLPGVSFHARTLSDQKVIQCVRTRKVRGSTEHFYVSKVLDNDLVAGILKNTEKDDGFLCIQPGRK